MLGRLQCCHAGHHVGTVSQRLAQDFLAGDIRGGRQWPSGHGRHAQRRRGIHADRRRQRLVGVAFQAAGGHHPQACLRHQLAHLRQFNGGRQAIAAPRLDRSQNGFAVAQGSLRDLVALTRRIIFVISVHDAIDQLLMRAVVEEVCPQRQAMRAVAQRATLPEVKQQPLQRRQRHHATGTGIHVKTLPKNLGQLIASRHVAAHHVRRQHRQERSIHNAHGRRSLPCLAPCQPGVGAVALGKVNKLGQIVFPVLLKRWLRRGRVRIPAHPDS
ncbi:hypothetical protein D3C72_1476670 [compost metagenome]